MLTIRQKYRALIEPIHEDLAQNRHSMRDLSPDDPNLQALAEKHGHLIAQMIILHKRQKLDTLAILTDDQRRQLTEKRNWCG